MTTYYVDPYWMLYDVLNRILYEIKNLIRYTSRSIGRSLTRFPFLWTVYRFVTMAVDATYTGLVNSVRHFTKANDFVISPRGIVIENTWTNYGTGTTASVNVNCATVPNSYLVACVVDPSAVTFSAPLLNGVAMTKLCYGAANVPVGIYGFANPPTGAVSFTLTISSSSNWRVVCYQLSGVDLSDPLCDAQQATCAPGTSLSVTLVAEPYGIMIDAIKDGTTPQNSQVMTVVNSYNVSGVLYPDTTSITSGYTFSSQNSHLNVVTLNPA